jgi:penicillin-binding protein 2
MLGPGFEDRRSSQGRLLALRVFVMVCFGVLALTFWVLQVLDNEEYREKAKANHLRTIGLRAPRGVFYDRHGKVLVDNRNAFSIAIIRERSTNIKEAVRRLARVTGVDETRIDETMKAHRNDPLFQPISVIDHATDVQVAAVMARRLELPEVVVQELPVRSYPAAGVATHMVGYVNEISAAELNQAEYAGLSSGTMIGKTGLEKTYNAKLMGKDGRKDVFVDSQNREVGEPISTDAPTDGHRLQLTIDIDVQRAIEEAFKANELSGAAAPRSANRRDTRDDEPARVRS